MGGRGRRVKEGSWRAARAAAWRVGGGALGAARCGLDAEARACRAPSEVLDLETVGARDTLNGGERRALRK